MQGKKIIGTSMPLFALGDGHSEATFERCVPFLNWLQKTNQSAWQLLPLNQTHLVAGSSTQRARSPYKGYGIGLDPRYLPSQDEPRDSSWIEENEYWLEDYAAFCALAEHFGTDDWRKWEARIRDYEPAARLMWKEKLQKRVQYHKDQQYTLHKAYSSLRQNALERDILLIGDLPYYVSLESPLVWAHQPLFELGLGGGLAKVSGVLAGHFGRQIWGHPLYNWGLGRDEKIIDLFKIRLRYHAQLFDLIRLDHATAFFFYGAIDIANKQNDMRRNGPGDEVFARVVHYAEKIGLQLYVEDSGSALERLRSAMEKYSLPGIKIYRFAYNEKEKMIAQKYADISSYPQNCVAYTTTHDTQTLMGYLKLLTNVEKQKLSHASHVQYSESDSVLATYIRNAIIKSAANIVIIPIQDWLLLDDRINTPGTEREKNDPNWLFRLKTPIEELPVEF